MAQVIGKNLRLLIFNFKTSHKIMRKLCTQEMAPIMSTLATRNTALKVQWVETGFCEFPPVYRYKPRHHHAKNVNLTLSHICLQLCLIG